MEASLVKVRALMAGIKAPQHYDKVFKDECIFTFDTPFSEGGLAVNLKSWQGFSVDMVSGDVARNGGKGGLYLMQKFTRVAKEAPPEGAAEPEKLAIGLPGGFLEDKWTVVKEHSLLVVDAAGARDTLPFPHTDLPMIVASVCEAIIGHQGATSMDESSRWEQDLDLKDSKYYKDLVQLAATRKISPNPKDWKCEISGETQNLWLNLSDGHIGGGRRNWDGSGGSNGALDHFNEEKAKGNFYPLVVKLGTITAQGADVYSYAPDQDDMVKDPLLAKHLEHWGIDVMKMEKTDKTLAELEVDLNKNHDFSRVTEDGDKALVRLRGPGLVGLRNLGNSCYMNASVQMLCGLPEVKRRYLDEDFQIRAKGPSEAPADLVTQVAKLVHGLNSSRYAPAWKDGDDQDDPKLVVAPGMFKALIGKGHPEFSSGRQQDAAEFVQYFLEQLSRAERTALGSRLEAGSSMASLFEFAVEERLQEAGGAKRVKYSKLRQNMLGLPVELDDAENLAEVMAFKAARAESGEKDAKKPKTAGAEEKEEPKALIKLEKALERLAAPEDGIAFRGTSVGKTSRLATMPKYLILQVQRYYLDEKWVPSKLDCKVPMPMDLDLEHLRGKGQQAGEEAFPEDSAEASAAPAAAAASPEADEMIVAQLLSMGLTENAAKRAALAVQNSNAEAAVSWYFEHSEDPGINDPISDKPAAGGGGGGEPAADPEQVAMLSSMGFAQAHVEAVLKYCKNDAERAADWLFSHADDIEGAVAALSGSGGGGGAVAAGAGEAAYDDGAGKYSLIGFVSHIGRHTSHGHYVCHMRSGEDGGWVIFNDQKVAKSEDPPFELGYLYLYRRADAA